MIRKETTMRRRISILAAALVTAFDAHADVRLPAVFSDHMVLQRDAEVPVWGWAEPGEKVVVTLAGQRAEATADAGGAWRAKLGRLAAGGPHALKVEGKNTVEIQDVLIGEVWLASGQSNMAMTVNRARDFEKECAASNLPQIRMFTTARTPAREPAKDCKGSWAICSPETVGGFSATAYFFAREIHRALGVPVGILNSSVGGTPIEAWTSLDACKLKAELKPVLESWASRAATYDPVKAKAAHEKQLAAFAERAKRTKADGKKPPRRPKAPMNPRDDTHYPGNLFNGMIAPLVPYAIRGAIWYQGENNTRGETAAFYDVLLDALIGDWRARWDGKAPGPKAGAGFPFAWVQLPNFNAPPDRDWPAVREGMRRALAIPDTGMAITLDIGDPSNIHPTNKQEVGHRLALWAMAKAYGKNIAYSGPLLRSHEIRGNEIRLIFDHAEGLKADGEPAGFEVRAADGSWHKAIAKIDGDAVVVSSPDVTAPTAARYACSNNPAAPLSNATGIPASPFTTGIPALARDQ